MVAKGGAFPPSPPYGVRLGAVVGWADEPAHSDGGFGPHLGVRRGARGAAVGVARAGGWHVRVSRRRRAVGAAPYDGSGGACVDGMGQEDSTEFGWALESEQRLEAELRREADGLLTRLAVDPATLL